MGNVGQGHFVKGGWSSSTDAEADEKETGHGKIHGCLQTDDSIRRTRMNGKWQK